MAYDHYAIEIQLATGILCSGTGDKAKWGPSRIPYIVKGFGLVPTTTKAKVTKPVAAIRLATAGVASVTGNEKGTLTLISGATKGVAFFRKSLTPFKVNPGDEAVIAIKTAVTVAFKARAVIYVEPSWDEPGALGTGVIKTVTA